MRFRHAVEACLHFQRAARGEKRVEVQLLWHHTDRCAGLARVFILIEAPDFHLTFGFLHKARQNVDQCGLARAVWPKQAEHAAFGDCQVDPL